MAHVGAVRPIRRLLVANRGEIARRIFRTARAMGIETAAVYADGDDRAAFVREADIAVALNGRTAAESYLDIGKLLDAVARVGADAIHPGYGFLAENARFAQRAIDAGLIFVGPPPDVIAQMGDKLAAKKLMAEAGVPTLPAIALAPGQNPGAAARAIGYPLLVKASSGGGGRGMRVVNAESDLASAIESARREAGAAFGDDGLFLERWLERARHVEIQILGDQHGGLVHCFERECSIQRRYQKLIEEAPSPAVNNRVRNAMCEAALSAARRLGYSSAGTVEFLLDGEAFWFLEVNTRLQVEHPVTEAIVGKDLVREQIRIAEGEVLSFSQRDLSIQGWAIEARLCAEDPENDFLPSPGVVHGWSLPSAELVRVDSAVESGDTVGAGFDPLIAKVIAHAPSRREAAAKLSRALELTEISGIRSNRDFLVAVLRTREFLAGDTTTDFIARVAPSRRRAVNPQELIAVSIAAAVEAQAQRRTAARAMYSIPSGFRLSVMPLEEAAFEFGGKEIRLAYRRHRDGTFRFVVDGREIEVVAYACGAGEVDLQIDGVRHQFHGRRERALWRMHGRWGDLELKELPRYPEPAEETATGALAAPMPGIIRAVNVALEQSVLKGQVLVVLEAMKMELAVSAPRDGIVAAISTRVGEQVANGQVLLTLRDDCAAEGDSHHARG